MTEEARILQRIVERDQDAMAQFYDRYGGIVFTVCKKVLGNPASTETAAQATFVAVWDAARSFNPNRASLKSWVLSIARNKAIDAWRREWRDRETGPIEEVDTAKWPEKRANPLAEAIESERQQLVREALEAIPDEQRKALYLAYFRGLSQSEISETLSTPLGTVKTRMKLGLEKLRKSLGPVLSQ